MLCFTWGTSMGIVPRLWSNCKEFLEELTAGHQYMSKSQQQALSKSNKKPLVKQFIDKAGKRRHVGIRDNLRASQTLGCIGIGWNLFGIAALG